MRSLTPRKKCSMRRCPSRCRVGSCYTTCNNDSDVVETYGVHVGSPSPGEYVAVHPDGILAISLTLAVSS